MCGKLSHSNTRQEIKKALNIFCEKKRYYGGMKIIISETEKRGVHGLGGTKNNKAKRSVLERTEYLLFIFFLNTSFVVTRTN